MKNLIGYLRRYWVLLLLWACSLVIALNDWLFRIAGTVIYLPLLALGALLTALLMRNVFNRDTTDHDADTGRFVAEWRALDARTRVILSVVQMLCYFLGSAIIAAALIA